MTSPSDKEMTRKVVIETLNAPGANLCAFCGEIFKPGSDLFVDVIVAVADHALYRCRNSPLLRRIADLEAEVEVLRLAAQKAEGV